MKLNIDAKTLKQIILFVMFIGFSAGSVALITAAFYIAPMTIYLPYRVEPVTISGADLAAIMALGAVITLFLLLETIR